MTPLMHVGTLDAMVAAASEALGTDRTQMSDLVTDLASRWPNEPALAICFALTSAAADLEVLLDGQAVVAAAAYRCAALVAADILAIEAMGQRPATGHHLLHFWRRAGAGYLDP